MQREIHEARRRDPALYALYSREAQRMHTHVPCEPTQSDSAVLLPILLLLYTEGADLRLLLALLYILL